MFFFLFHEDFRFLIPSCYTETAQDFDNRCQIVARLSDIFFAFCRVSPCRADRPLQSPFRLPGPGPDPPETFCPQGGPGPSSSARSPPCFPRACGAAAFRAASGSARPGFVRLRLSAPAPGPCFPLRHRPAARSPALFRPGSDAVPTRPQAAGARDLSGRIRLRQADPVLPGPAPGRFARELTARAGKNRSFCPRTYPAVFTAHPPEKDRLRAKFAHIFACQQKGSELKEPFVPHLVRGPGPWPYSSAPLFPRHL